MAVLLTAALCSTAPSYHKKAGLHTNLRRQDKRIENFAANGLFNIFAISLRFGILAHFLRHAKLLRDCFAIPTAHAAWVAAGRKAWGRWFCDDFQVAQFSVSISLSGLFFPPSGPAFLLPVRHVSKCKIAGVTGLAFPAGKLYL
jgi:hypothetical protein